MSVNPVRVRLLALGAAAGFLTVAIGIRYLRAGGLYSNGLVEQDSGTALYASTVYAGVLLLRPRTRPLPTGAIALAWCWAVEVAQLTGVPAWLSARNLVLRLVFGTSFDWNDMLWYPVGIVPLVLVHWLLARSRATYRTHRQKG